MKGSGVGICCNFSSPDFLRIVQRHLSHDSHRAIAAKPVKNGPEGSTRSVSLRLHEFLWSLLKRGWPIWKPDRRDDVSSSIEVTRCAASNSLPAENFAARAYLEQALRELLT